MMPRAFEEHTGEVRLRLQADSLPGLFEEAALAVAELMCTDRSDPQGGALPVRVEARDREALLAAWVDELVFLSETRKRVWSEARVEHLVDTELVATVRGFEPAALRTQIKAATLHDLHIAETPSGSFEATLVLDV
jgi:SHS2 domain-containing protein